MVTLEDGLTKVLLMNTHNTRAMETEDISIYLSCDKDFIAVAKKSILLMKYIFFLFS